MYRYVGGGGDRGRGRLYTGMWGGEIGGGGGYICTGMCWGGDRGKGGCVPVCGLGGR